MVSRMRVYKPRSYYMDWKFKSSWEQRHACRGKWASRFPFKTKEEAEEACREFSHFWRGTKTVFEVIPEGDGFTVSQDLEYEIR
mgnify:CR=1 FL=1